MHRRMFGACAELFCRIGIHPQGTVCGSVQDMRTQLTVLALPAMIKHHAVFVVQRSDEYHGIRPFRQPSCFAEFSRLHASSIARRQKKVNFVDVFFGSARLMLLFPDSSRCARHETHAAVAECRRTIDIKAQFPSGFIKIRILFFSILAIRVPIRYTICSSSDKIML